MAEWLTRYIATRPLTAKAAYQLRRSCQLLDDWLGYAPDVDEIDEVRLSEWLGSLERQYSARYVANHRAHVLGVLRLAADAGVRAEPRPRLIRRVNIPPPDPVAWTAREFAALLSATAKLKGKVRSRPRITRSHYLATMISAAFDTGARLGDLRRLEHDWISRDGVVRFRISKTAAPHVAQLSQRSVELIAGIPYPRPLKWQDKSVEYYALWREACAAAGIPYGATQQVRRTAATVVWRDDPAAVQRFLGHRTSTMWRHYVDTLQGTKPVRPREFWRQDDS